MGKEKQISNYSQNEVHQHIKYFLQTEIILINKLTYTTLCETSKIQSSEEQPYLRSSALCNPAMTTN